MTNVRNFSKNAGVQSVGKRRIMRVLKINEISGVDVPAQQGATAPIMKRHGAQDNSNHEQNLLAKKACLTTAVDGHSHILYMDHGNGELNAGETSWVNGHSHPWVRLPDGSIQIGEASGHSHDVATVGKQADANQPGDPEMSKTPEQIAAMEAELALTKSVNALPADQRAHYDALSEADRPAFLAKSDADRSNIVKQLADLAKSANAVVYKAKDGTEYTKSHDPLLVAMAKRLDAQDDELAKANEKAKDAEYVKRAGEIANLPGKQEDHIEMLKAIDGIKDEAARKRSIEALKAQSVALGNAFGESGDSFETPEAADANEKLDQLAKNYMAKNVDLTEAQAMDAVLKTREGRELYAQATQQ